MSFKHWVIVPKQALIDTAMGSDIDELICQPYIINGGSKLTHHFTGAALVNAGPEYFRNTENARFEWVKITYLASLAEEYNEKFIEEVSELVGSFEISEDFFDKWWNVSETEDVVDADEVFYFSPSVKKAIQVSDNELTKHWLDKICHENT